MTIRKATVKDLEAIFNVEKECFPIKEACSKEEFRNRLKYYPNHFLLMYDKNKLVSFVDGMVTNNKDLSDEMYNHAEYHSEEGNWQMIFGVNTILEYRNKGCAETLLRKFINIAKREGRKGVVLTCKKELIPYYSKFGFKNEGISNSKHGDVIWYQMRLTF